MIPDVAVAEARVGLNNFSFCGAIPTAEKRGLLMLGAAFLADKTFNALTGVDLKTFLLIGAGAFYLYNKYQQDQAVEKYYKETKNVMWNPWIMQDIYRDSENVKAMGGFDAIRNACSTRIFTKR